MMNGSFFKEKIYDLMWTILSGFFIVYLMISAIYKIIFLTSEK